jgi:ribosomal protein L7/L12
LVRTIDDLAQLAARIEACRKSGREVSSFDDDVLGAVGPPRSPPDPAALREVRLVGWERGILKVSATKVVRHFSGLGLADSKGRVDRLLEGEAVSIPVARGDVETFCALVRALGARVDA